MQVYFLSLTYKDMIKFILMNIQFIATCKAETRLHHWGIVDRIPVFLQCSGIETFRDTEDIIKHERR